MRGRKFHREREKRAVYLMRGIDCEIKGSYNKCQGTLIMQDDSAFKNETVIYIPPLSIQASKSRLTVTVSRQNLDTLPAMHFLRIKRPL
jgi:hypothetical protein